MPLMNLNPAARQRHQVRVITVGFFRMLKSMQTYKVVKTKTEISALNEFIEWIEQRHREDEGSQGVILIYHEQRKFVPYMIIEALKKYNLLDRFMTTVKSFANGFKLAEEKCSKTIKYFSIRQLAKIVFEKDAAEQLKDGFEGNAYTRAKLAYEIAKHLATEHKKRSDPNDDTATTEETDTSKAETDTSKTGGDDEEEATDSNNTSAATTNDEDEMERMVNTLCDLASPITQELSELDEQEKILVRQNSLRPVFLQYFKTTLYHR
jgi:maternal-effect protein exuperantia